MKPRRPKSAFSANCTHDRRASFRHRSINLPFLNLLVGFALGVFTGFLLKLILKF